MDVGGKAVASRQGARSRFLRSIAKGLSETNWVMRIRHCPYAQGSLEDELT
jgi:hypothetical protein